MTDPYESGLEKARHIVDVLEDKKGADILLLDLIGVCSFTDYFVICTGASERTLRALSDEVRKQLKSRGEQPLSATEGDAESGWMLVDFGDVVMHLFLEPVRHYYDLESLWDSGRVVVRLK